MESEVSIFYRNRFGFSVQAMGKVEISALLRNCSVSNVVIYTAIDQKCELHTRSAFYVLGCCIPFLRTVARITLTIRSLPLVFGVLRLLNLCFWPSCASPSSPVTLMLITFVHIPVFFSRVRLCVFWLPRLRSRIHGQRLSNFIEFLCSTRCLSPWSFHDRPG